MAQRVPIEGDDYDLVIALAKECGFSSKLAQKQLARRGVLATRRQVYKIWAKEGISVRKFRDGQTPQAKARIQEVLAPIIRPIKLHKPRQAMG